VTSFSTKLGWSSDDDRGDTSPNPTPKMANTVQPCGCNDHFWYWVRKRLVHAMEGYGSDNAKNRGKEEEDEEDDDVEGEKKDEEKGEKGEEHRKDNLEGEVQLDE
jgi:hypothetical protein